jgi:Ran GTPase-activating protein (RanGAP) involved in mRNA processing and transport
LDIELCHFNEDGAKYLAKMLEHNRSIKELSCTENSIGNDGINAILSSLSLN